MGRGLFCAVEDDGNVALERGMEMMGLLFLSDAGVVIVEPTIEAWILDS